MFSFKRVILLLIDWCIWGEGPSWIWQHLAPSLPSLSSPSLPLWWFSPSSPSSWTGSEPVPSHLGHPWLCNCRRSSHRSHYAPGQMFHNILEAESYRITKVKVFYALLWYPGKIWFVQGRQAWPCCCFRTVQRREEHRRDDGQVNVTKILMITIAFNDFSVANSTDFNKLYGPVTFITVFITIMLLLTKKEMITKWWEWLSGRKAYQRSSWRSWRIWRMPKREQTRYATYEQNDL